MTFHLVSVSWHPSHWESSESWALRPCITVASSGPRLLPSGVHQLLNKHLFSK